MRNPARDRRGVAAVEFAALFPLMFLLLLGFLDIIYVVRGYLRVQSTAMQVGQYISQCRSVANTDESQLKDLAKDSLGTYATGRNWALVVTAVGTDSTGKPKQLWVIDNRSPNSGFVPDGATLPAGLTLKSDEVIFRTEVFADINGTFYTSTANFLDKYFGARLKSFIATTSLLYMSRSTDPSTLQTKTSTETCTS